MKKIKDMYIVKKKLFFKSKYLFLPIVIYLTIFCVFYTRFTFNDIYIIILIMQELCLWIYSLDQKKRNYTLHYLF